MEPGSLFVTSRASDSGFKLKFATVHPFTFRMFEAATQVPKSRPHSEITAHQGVDCRLGMGGLRALGNNPPAGILFDPRLKSVRRWRSFPSKACQRVPLRNNPSVRFQPWSDSKSAIKGFCLQRRYFSQPGVYNLNRFRLFVVGMCLALGRCFRAIACNGISMAPSCRPSSTVPASEQATKRGSVGLALAFGGVAAGAYGFRRALRAPPPCICLGLPRLVRLRIWEGVRALRFKHRATPSEKVFKPQ